MIVSHNGIKLTLSAILKCGAQIDWMRTVNANAQFPRRQSIRVRHTQERRGVQ